MAFLRLGAFLVCSSFLTVCRADFPIPLPFDRLVGDSAIIIQGKVLRMTPLIPKNDKLIPDAAIVRLSGPKCFSILRVEEHWKEAREDDEDSPRLHEFITVAHGYSRWAGRGISHDLTEGRSYVLFLTQEGDGLCRMTDGNSVYPIVDGEVPSIGLNMLDEDVAKSDPVSVADFEMRVERQLQTKPASASPGQPDADDQ